MRLWSFHPRSLDARGSVTLRLFRVVPRAVASREKSPAIDGAGL